MPGQAQSYHGYAWEADRRRILDGIYRETLEETGYAEDRIDLLDIDSPRGMSVAPAMSSVIKSSWRTRNV